MMSKTEKRQKWRCEVLFRQRRYVLILITFFFNLLRFVYTYMMCMIHVCPISVTQLCTTCRCCLTKTLYLHFCRFSVFHMMRKRLLFFILCVNFKMNGPKETAQNYLVRCLVPLTYIKSKVRFSFSCKVTIFSCKHVGASVASQVWM